MWSKEAGGSSHPATVSVRPSSDVNIALYVSVIKPGTDRMLIFYRKNGLFDVKMSRKLLEF